MKNARSVFVKRCLVAIVVNFQNMYRTRRAQERTASYCVRSHGLVFPIAVACGSLVLMLPGNDPAHEELASTIRDDLFRPWIM